MERAARLADDAGDEPLTVGAIFLGDDGGLADPGHERDRGLDFGKLDAEAAHLHLAVSPAQQLQHASLAPPRRSPVAYIRDPGLPCGSGRNRSAVWRGSST